MPRSDESETELKRLKSAERSIVMSFLTLSERKIGEDSSAMDELSVSLAVRAALNKKAN